MLEPVLTRPGRPFWVQGQREQLTALFPVYLKGRPDDALLTAFAQVRLAACPMGMLQVTFPTHDVSLAAVLLRSNVPRRGAALAAAMQLLSWPSCSLG